MNMLRSKRTLAGAAALAVAVGAGGAIAASKGSTTSKDGFLARVAGHLGISPQKLEDATKAAALDQVDADLKAGRITKAEADELKARIQAGNVPLFGGPHKFGGFGHHGRGGDKLSAAAAYLELTESQLREKLAVGTTLAGVAKAENKSVDGLEDAMIESAQKRLDQAVEDGDLTKAQADEMKADLATRIDGIVNGTFPGRGERREFRRHGEPKPDAGFLMPAA